MPVKLRNFANINFYRFLRTLYGQDTEVSMDALQGSPAVRNKRVYPRANQFHQRAKFPRMQVKCMSFAFHGNLQRFKEFIRPSARKFKNQISVQLY